MCLVANPPQTAGQCGTKCQLLAVGMGWSTFYNLKEPNKQLEEREEHQYRDVFFHLLMHFFAVLQEQVLQAMLNNRAVYLYFCSVHVSTLLLNEKQVQKSGFEEQRAQMYQTSSQASLWGRKGGSFPPSEGHPLTQKKIVWHPPPWGGGGEALQSVQKKK